MAILQPGDDQTFYLKSYPSGQQYECYLTAHEILELAKKLDPTFDSIALGAYAYDYFGYWIFPFTLGSQDVVNFRDSGLSGPTDGDYIAVDKDVSSYNTTYIINEDGTALDDRLGTNGWSYQYNYDLGSPYWFRVVNFGVLPVIYTESNYNKLFLNGEEYQPGNATIRVNYYLPDDNYEYARITYKKNDKPESVNDGTIVPISPNNSYIDIPKFIEGQSYWFKIFTNKSESEAFPYTVGEMERPFYILPKLSAKFKIFCSSGTDVELSVQEIYDKLTTSGHIAPEEAKTFILYQTTSTRGYVIGLFPVYTSSLKLYTKEGLSQEYTDDYITGIDYDSATSYSLRFYLNADLTLRSLGYGSTYLTSYKTINDVWISAWGTSITGAIMPIVYCNTNPSEYSSIYLNDKQISVNVN